MGKKFTPPRNTQRVSFWRISVSASHSQGVTRVELAEAEIMKVIGDKNQESWSPAWTLPLAGFIVLGKSFKFVLT